jgi:DNA polymerase-3 subunit alpha
MDFLGLKTLTLIKNTLALLKRRGIDLDLDTIPENDENTYKLLGEGKSTCVFQFESSGMQGILKRAQPSKIEDLIALNALYRPGPMDNIDQFIDSKRGKTPIRYPLPVLEDVLKETYGVIVYQEQVMEIARKVAGYSLGQADILRRIMGKKKPEEMPRLKGEFIQGALNSGYDKKQAEALFDLLIPFAGYGFNKSHAAAYSVLAYKTAYLKANYPAEFMAANLTNEISDTNKLTAYMEEAKSMGIGILPPDINISEKYYSVSSGKIVYGLIGIKNVGSSAVDEIIRVRSEDGAFSSITDFLERVDLKTVNRKVIEMLIQAGCFDSLHSNRAGLFNSIERLIETAAAKKASLRYGQTSLFEGEEVPAASMPVIAESEEWPQDELLKREYEALGFYFSGHPMDGLKEQWKKKVNLNIADAGKSVPDKKYSLIGLLKNLKEIQTKKGDRMAFAELEDYNGNIELVIFPEVFKKYLPYLSNDEIIGIIGTVETRKGSPQIIVDEVKAPEDLDEQDVPEVHIRIEGDIDNEEDLYGLRAFLFERNGESPVFIHVNGHNGEQESVVRASAQITVAAGGSFMTDIHQYPHVVEVWKQ